jgi:head-tail adaptor
MIVDYYDSIVYLQSPTYTQDSYGQNIATWSSGVAISVCLQGRSGSYPVINGIEYVSKGYKIYCSSTVNITLQDRIFDGATNYYYPTFIKETLKGSHHKEIDLDLGRGDRN